MLKKLFFLSAIIFTGTAALAQNVGIGTTTPTEKLQVAGNIKADTLKPQMGIKFLPNAAKGRLLTSDSLGNASWQKSLVDSIYSPQTATCISLTGTAGTAYAAVSLAINSTNAFVITIEDSLKIYNTNNPALPTQVSGIHTGVGPTDVAVSGNYAFVVHKNFDNMLVYNITNPNSPAQIGTVNYPTSQGSPTHLTVAGNYAYVVNGYGNTLLIYDISNPSNPTQTASIPTGSNPLAVVVQDSLVYVVNQVSNTLAIYNVSNHSLPVFRGSVATGASPFSVAVKGNYAYVVNVGDNNMTVYNITNAASPLQVGSAVPTGTYPSSIAVLGSYAVVSNLYDNSLSIINITNPAAPFTAGTAYTGTYPSPVKLLGQYAYVTNTISNTLQIFKLFCNISSTILINADGIPGITPILWQSNGISISNINSGNVGIGTTTPSRKLVVVGDASISGTLGIAGAVDIGGAVGIGTTTPATQLDVMGTTGIKSSSSGTWIAGNFGNNIYNTNRVVMGYYGDAATIGAHNYTLNSWANISINPGGGNVGIGTTNPTNKLDVIGNASVTGTMGIGTNTPATQLEVKGTTGIKSSSSGTWIAGNFGDNTNTNNRVVMGYQSGAATIAGNNNALTNWANLAINPGGGNVGIGTTNPTNKLEVIGNTKTDGLQITAGAANGYILQSNASGNASWVSTTLLGLENLYNIDGTLTGNRTVTMGANNLNFASSTGNLIFNPSTSGNMGIGTSTPSNKLEVKGTTGIKSSSSGIWIAGNFGDATTTNDRVVMGYISGSATIGGHNNALNGWANLAINPGGGNVGIGTSTPTNKLEVVGNTSITGNIGVGTTSPTNKLEVIGKIKTNDLQITTGATSGFILQTDASGNASWVTPSSLGIGSNLYNSDGTVTGSRTVTMGANDINFASSTGNLIFNPSASGNMGIGTTTPTNKLEIIGNTKTDNLYVTSNIGIGINNPTMTLMIRNNVTTPNSNIASLGNAISDPSFALDVRKGNTSDVMVQLGLQYAGSTPNSSIRFHRGASSNDGFMSFTTNADVERMRINASGNVGIGTSTPTNKLDVIGNTKTDNLYVTSNIGIGTTTPANRLEVIGNASISGNVGIGTVTPANKLEVIGNTSISGNLDIVGTGIKASNNVSGWIAGNFGITTAGTDRVVMGYISNAATIGAHNNALTAWANLAINPSGGNVGIGTSAPTALLSVNGDANKIGNAFWSTFSDERVKQNVQNYTLGLNEVLAIRPVSFQYNGKGLDKADGKTYIGILAQEIEKILPGTVTKIAAGGFTDLRQYNGSELTYTIINAVKELADRNTKIVESVGVLQKIIENLKKQQQLEMEALLKRLEALEKK